MHAFFCYIFVIVASYLLQLWHLFLSNISVCLSLCPADFNINSPSLNLQHRVGLCHPRSCKNYQKGCVSFRKPRAGLDLDGDLFLPCLLYAVVLHWADMMPSHSMDLPVPRGTSMLMLGGNFISYVTNSAMQMCVSHSKYVLMYSFCFSSDGKSPCTCCESQITSNLGCLWEKLSAVIFILALSLTYDFYLYGQEVDIQIPALNF